MISLNVHFNPLFNIYGSLLPELQSYVLNKTMVK